MIDIKNHIEGNTPFTCKVVARNLIILLKGNELLTLRRTNDLITLHKLRAIPNAEYYKQYLIFHLRAGGYNVEA